MVEEVEAAHLNLLHMIAISKSHYVLASCMPFDFIQSL